MMGLRKCVAVAAMMATQVMIPCPATAGGLAPRAALTSYDDASLHEALDAARRATGAPGASAAIVIDGRLVWLGVSGTVDLRTGQPVTPHTVFSLASVSKLFVAAIIMRLQETSSLRLADPIAGYVPAYVHDARRVTVGELLAHTSGYADDEDDPVMLRLLADPNYPWTRDDVMRREGRVRSVPGSRYAYCNSCYVMLGGVIERASGASVGQELQRLVIAPLHLQDDVDIDRVTALAPRVARGYDVQHGKLVDTFVGAHSLGVPTGDWGPVWTDGGVVATTQGVARFTDALFAGRLLRRASLDALLAPPRPGIALESQRLDGVEWRGHSGFYVGFTAESWHDAARHLTIVVLTNRTDDADPATVIWDRLAHAFDHLRAGK